MMCVWYTNVTLYYLLAFLISAYLIAKCFSDPDYTWKGPKEKQNISNMDKRKSGSIVTVDRFMG